MNADPYLMFRRTTGSLCAGPTALSRSFAHNPCDGLPFHSVEAGTVGFEFAESVDSVNVTGLHQP
jgi:hypothetical protein